MSSAKTIAKNTVLLFSKDIVEKVLSFFLVILITRYLGDAGFGMYSFVFAFVSTFAIFTNLGLNTYALREISKDKSKTEELINNTFTLRIITEMIVFTINRYGFK